MSIKLQTLSFIPGLITFVAVTFFDAPHGWLDAAQAEDDEAKARYIGAQQQVLRADPGGASIGSISPSTPVTQGEIRGRWAQVIVQAWVPVESLSDAPSIVAGTAAVRPGTSQSGPLEIVEYELNDISKSAAGDTPRVQIKITIKNTSSQPIKNWEGMLVAQRPNGQVLFRLPVSDDTQVIQPNGTADVNFYWAKGEQFYDLLSGETKQTVQVLLFRVTIK